MAETAPPPAGTTAAAEHSAAAAKTVFKFKCATPKTALLRVSVPKGNVVKPRVQAINQCKQRRVVRVLYKAPKGSVKSTCFSVRAGGKASKVINLKKVKIKITKVTAPKSC